MDTKPYDKELPLMTERARSTSSYNRFWTPTKVGDLCDILKKYQNASQAVHEVSQYFAHAVTANSIRMVLRENDIQISSILQNKTKTGTTRVWTDENIIKTITCFIGADTVKDALSATEAALDRPLTEEAVAGMLRRLHISRSLSDLLGKSGNKALKKAKKQIQEKTKSEKIRKLSNKKSINAINKKLKLKKQDNEEPLEQKILNYLVKASKNKRRSNIKNRTNTTLRDLCNMFDCSPHRVEIALEKAKLEGHRVQISDTNIGINTSVIDNEGIIGPRPIIRTKKLLKNTVRFAVISDTHFGSAHCLKDEIIDFVNMAYDEFDVRLILHAGDILAGNNVYRGQQFELEKWACKDQCQICVDTLPVRKNLQYVYIMGNHDVDFMKSNGTDPSDLIDAWRPDMKCVGTIASRFILDPYDLDIELSHIKTSAHARSWSLEKHLQKTISKHNAPDILFCGHKHTNGYFTPQNVHSCLVPCFETINIYGTYGDFYPTIGGIIVTVTLDDTGRITRFNPLFHTYPIEFQTTVNSSEIL